jgi:hypothetical protein
MLEFLKKTRRKRGAAISKYYRLAADYGKKTVILSCELATIGDIGPNYKGRRPNNDAKNTRLACSAARCGIVPSMSSPPANNRPVHIYGTRTPRSMPGITDLLRGATGIAALLPMANKMARLQADCAAALPAMFGQCDILRFEEGNLTLAVGNAAIAAKLKQQVPKLQTSLRQRGWQVEAVKLKVQMARVTPPEQVMRSLELPNAALSAFEELSTTLPDTPQNQTLIAALKAMAARRR